MKTHIFFQDVDIDDWRSIEDLNESLIIATKIFNGELDGNNM